MENNYKHIVLQSNAEIDRYTNPVSGRSDGFNIFKVSDRHQHGNKLKDELNQAISDFQDFRNLQKEESLPDDLGLTITFESWEGFELKFESLEDKKSKIEIVNIQNKNGKYLATVHIPEGKVKVFFDKIEAYLKDFPPDKNPKNQPLIENIESIKLAAIENFWIDSDVFPTNFDLAYWLEIWLRVGDNRDEIISKFRDEARKINIYVSDGFIKFPENSVLKAHASVNQLKESLSILDCLSEIRISKETPATFLEMLPMEESEWGFNLKDRVVLHPDFNKVSVCILDTGVNFSHPLLEQSISEEYTDSFNPSWGKTDHELHGHGTAMAGLALYGDLYPLLLNNHNIELKHSLESVKILPPKGENPKDLLGVITQECVARAELFDINKRRFFSMAVTVPDNIINEGEASSWSTAIDQISFGDYDIANTKKLFFISAGNIREDNKIKEYPDSNFKTSIEDPAQSWNSLTVGAITEKIYIEKSSYPEYEPIAQKGSLSPSSTTSLIWGSKSDWPIKPDIVMEGGNYGKSKNDFISKLESLSLITTNKDFQNKLFTMTNDTSAATAQAARYAAIISSEYPTLWPESIRGLLIHSANYEKLNHNYKNIKGKVHNEKIKILRKYGFGKPDLNRALKSGSDFCTLIIQDEIKPFIKNGSNIETNEIRYYDLPWPVVVFQQISCEVELKVTLSYFIEPNPKKFNSRLVKTYSSCGLRFDSKAPTEDDITFKKRINKKSREIQEDGKHEKGFNNPDNRYWVLGNDLRDHGSIHSDVWIGSSTELADKNKICVYPTGGWWKTRKKLEKYDHKIRFSLIISIKTEKIDIDIYNAILSIININNIPILT